MLLGIDEPRVRTLFPTTRDPLATLTTLETALRRRPSFDEVADALTRAFEREHGVAPRPAACRRRRRRVSTLVTDRYARPAWLATPA